MVVACPLCGSTPPPSYLWICFPGCETQWDTFATGGRCPGCGRQWTHTSCPDCCRLSPHEQWYRESDAATADLAVAAGGNS